MLAFKDILIYRQVGDLIQISKKEEKQWTSLFQCFLFLARVLSNASPQAVYLKSKVLFDRLTGGVMAGLGIKLVSNAGA